MSIKLYASSAYYVSIKEGEYKIGNYLKFAIFKNPEEALMSFNK
jgi:hypothetical protein